jgi:beta-phosphoglucomutase
MNHLWQISETSFDPERQHHSETIFTIGNGYLSTRGAFEEGNLDDHRATFVHGVFDAAPIVFSELANAPDWLPVTIQVNGERFSMATGVIESYERTLDLHAGILTRKVDWRSPAGDRVKITFERFASLADEHTLFLRCRVTPEFHGEIEVRASLNGNMHNEGLAHWDWLAQGQFGKAIYLLNRTRKSKIRFASAMRVMPVAGECLAEDFCDVENTPTYNMVMQAQPGKELIVDKYVAVYTARDTDDIVSTAVECITRVKDWQDALEDQRKAWAQEWERTDIIIEGDDEAQISMRFNLFQMLIAAPRHDDRVNIGAKTLSGFGYRGHAFWDTEIFMLPLFTFTAPNIARNLLNYRYRNLPGARAKAQQNGFEGAQFPWESADTGEEVTPAWIPDFTQRDHLIRIWTGDIEIHISADIAYAAMQYWKLTGDDQWMIEKGAELVLDTAKFWASRAEFNAQTGLFEYNDVIGPDEYHEHVDNNTFTNHFARWNIQTAFKVLEWLQEAAPEKTNELIERLSLTKDRLKHWRNVAEHIYFPAPQVGVLEQFKDYFQHKYIHLPDLEPRNCSVQVIYGIEGTNGTQVLKQPDVLMLMYLLRQDFPEQVIRTNYDYYTARTDHSFGSSLGPSIQAIMACEVGKPDDAYEHFIRAVRADLRDIRDNAGDGIHAASAGGTWQTVVFGFGGLRITEAGWSVHPRLPKHWKRLAFKFFYKGEIQQIDITPQLPDIQAFIFDLDGVLTDTAEFHFRGWKQLADEEGIPFDREDNEALRGISRRESLNLLLKGRTITEADAEAWMERKNNYYRSMLLEMTPEDMLPGALALLVQLRQAGIKIAIASASKNAPDVVTRLNLASAIDVLCDGHSVENPKPAPDLFLFAAKQLDIPPEACVVVEDAEAGVEAAIAAGMRSIGLGPVDRVGRADLVLPSLDGQDLRDILSRLALLAVD